MGSRVSSAATLRWVAHRDVCAVRAVHVQAAVFAGLSRTDTGVPDAFDVVLPSGNPDLPCLVALSAAPGLKDLPVAAAPANEKLFRSAGTGD
ncbi:hypothetical protein VTO73DRAFT_2755 [Trametes versicolor]